MSISLSRYVNINSSVGAAPGIPTRSLFARFFTGSTYLSPGTFLEFTSAADVGSYFGIYSEEYYRSLFYFGWVGKNLVSPSAIQFARFVKTATAPMIFPVPGLTQTLATYTSITNGAFGLTIGSTSHGLTSLDFSAAASLADVASILQTAIRAADVSTQWSTATVVYNTTIGGFVFTGGDSSVAASISIQPAASGTDISGVAYLGWYPGSGYTDNLFSSSTYKTNARWISGSPAVTITNTLTASVSLSNNFGSFAFLNNLSLVLSDYQEAATWNAAAAQNNMFLFSVPISLANVSTWASNFATFAGTSITASQNSVTQSAILNSTSTVTGLINATTTLQVGMPVSGTDIPSGTVIIKIVSDNQITLSQAATGSISTALTFNTAQFPEQAPMMIAAATNYSGTNTVQNYMFQNFDPYLTPLVTSDSTATSFDTLSLNYYGQTQSAGVNFNFYQRGLMQGPATAPLDQNTYIDEIWLKAAVSTAFINALLQLNQIPANNYGRSIALNIIQGVVNQALINGTISVGKTLTSAQIAFITEISQDVNAWYQVQNSGYWVDAVVQLIPNTSQYEIVYTLIYSKDDVIRFVSGQDILI